MYITILMTTEERRNTRRKIELVCDFVVEDVEKNAISNFIKCIEKGLQTNKKYLVVFQDDIVFKKNLHEKIKQIVEYMKTNSIDFISLYSNYKEDIESYQKKEEYRVHKKKWLNMQGIIISSELAKSYPKHAINEGIYKKKRGWVDVSLCNFLKKNKIPIYIKIPNIIDHCISMKSTLGHPKKCGKYLRVSRTYCYDR